MNANLEGQGSSLLGELFHRDLTDFDQTWYRISGDNIVGSMIFNLYLPVIIECLLFGVRYARRWYDASGQYATRSLSEKQYMDIHAGPEYFVHFKYSFLMNVTFITMMFGVGLPILFPIAFTTYLVIYCQEIYMLYYVYKRPPTYDEKLAKAVLNNLQYASLFLLGFGFWQISNF